jgi:hypothetical protein
MSSTTFMNVLTEEKKKIREFKYIIVINNQYHINNQYYSIVLDKSLKEHKIIIDQVASELDAFVIRLIDSIKYILEQISLPYRSYCLITIKSDNVYFITLINNWMKEWKDNDFNNHPSQMLLRELQQLLNNIHYKLIMCHPITVLYQDKNVNDIDTRILIKE